ncbi:MAG TPA: hypothetical protein VGK20_05695 [Candidatus Binatia bacterium]
MSDRLDEQGADDLPGDEQLRRLYRELSSDEPRAEVDRAILDAARDAVAATGRGRRSVLRLRYLAPLAAAAGVILTVALTRLAPPGSPLVSNVDDFASTNSAVRPSTPSSAARSSAMENERETTSTKRAKIARDAETAAKAARKPNPNAGVDSATQEKLRSLGYQRSDTPAAPPSAAVPAPPPPAVTAAPPAGMSGALASSQPRAQDFADMPDKKQSAEASASVLGNSPGRQRTPWPLGLDPGLSASEACERVSNAIHQSCSVVDGAADIAISPPATLESGLYAGRHATRVVLHLKDGQLASVILMLQTKDGHEEQVLVSSPSP